MSRGIDYSGPGATCNRDAETGIRFGVIGLNALDAELIADDLEAEYDNPACPKCGGELTDGGRLDYRCTTCRKDWHSDQCLPDESIGYKFVAAGYEGFVGRPNDLWITKSHFYTHAQFCSPCAPGACHLENPCPEGERAFCLGHEFFAGSPPYPIYSVATGELVDKP